MIRNILLLVLMLLLAAPAVICEQSTSSSTATCAIDYINKNRHDDNPLVFHSIAGQVVMDSEPVSGVCLGLFTESDHRLVESVTTDSKGHFKFNHAEPGDYRIVSQFSSCSGNTTVRIIKGNFATNLLNRRQLTIAMRPYAYGDCVYAIYKDF